MKTITLLVGLLICGCLNAQTPTPTPYPKNYRKVIVQPTPLPKITPMPRMTATPSPVVGFVVTGTQVTPVTAEPALLTSGIFFSGTTVPTAGAIALVNAKRAAIKALENSYAVAIAAGVPVTSGSIAITLAAGDSDQVAFMKLKAQFETDRSMPPLAEIRDKNGAPFYVSAPQFWSIVEQYGHQIGALYWCRATAKDSIASVTGTAALSKISLANPTGQ